MRKIIIKIIEHPNFYSILSLGKKVAVTGVAQILIQIVTFLSGIFVIRMLSTEEYAYYTLANTMLGAMSILTDSGVSSGVISIGGQNWQSKKHLGVVLQTGLALRKKFALASWLVVMPILAYMLYDHGATTWNIAFIVLSIVPLFFSTVSTSLLEIPLKLRQDINPLQKNQLLANLGRAVLLSIIFICPFSAVALLIASLPQLWANRRLWKLSEQYVDWNQEADSSVRTKMLQIVKRLLPEGIYNCLSGQLTIWLIALLGSTASIAQLGALSRFSVAMRILGVLSKTLVTPRFARLPNEKRIIFQRYVQIVGGMFLFFVFVVLILNQLSNPILSLLGGNYQGLNTAFLLVVIGGCLEVFADLSFNLNTSRGWAINPLISIPVNILTVVVSIFFLKIHSLEDILLLTIISSSVQIIMHIAYGLSCITKIKSNESQTA